MQAKVLITGTTILVVIAILAGGFWIISSKQHVEVTTLPAPKPTPAEATPEQKTPATTEHTPEDRPASTENLPPPPPEYNLITAPLQLQNSDPQVILAIADIAPTLSKWLLPAEQIRKWVLAIDLMAEGKLPKRYRPVDYPMASFAVQAEQENTVSAEQNVARLDNIINTITAIKPEQLLRYYHAWQPLLESAYQEQGKAGNFDQRLRQCISQILAVNPLQQPATLIRPNVLYQYTDQQLEQANDIEKLLWRMGQNNAENIQGFLRELRYLLDS